MPCLARLSERGTTVAIVVVVVLKITFGLLISDLLLLNSVHTLAQSVFF